MNFAQLITAVRTRLGVPATDAFYTDTVVGDLINGSLHYIESESPWPWLEKETTIATVNGTASYALPADYRQTLAVFDPSGFPLARATVPEMRLLIGASGVPKKFDRFSTNIRFAPTPAGVQSLTHVYVCVEPDLTGTNSPLLPSIWHTALVEHAAYQAFRRAGRAQDAGAAKAAYEDWLAQMKREAVSYTDDQGGGVVPAGSAENPQQQAPGK